MFRIGIVLKLQDWVVPVNLGGQYLTTCHELLQKSQCDKFYCCLEIFFLLVIQLSTTCHVDRYDMVVLEESSLGLDFYKKFLADLSLICIKYFCNLTATLPTKGNAQLTRKNDFSFT